MNKMHGQTTLKLGILLFILGKILGGTALLAGMSRVLFSMGLLEFLFLFFFLILPVVIRP